MMPSISEMNDPRTRRAVSMTSSWTSGCGSTPAAMFVMHETPSTSSPMCRAAIASGTVDNEEWHTAGSALHHDQRAEGRKVSIGAIARGSR